MIISKHKGKVVCISALLAILAFNANAALNIRIDGQKFPIGQVFKTLQPAFLATQAENQALVAAGQSKPKLFGPNGQIQEFKGNIVNILDPSLPPPPAP